MGVFSSIQDFKKAGTLAKQSLPYQDPTYLGFVLLFQWTDVPEQAAGQNLIHGSGATPYSPLFDPMGAEYYLKRLADITDPDAGAKFNRKLKALQNFKKALQKINKDMPWYWQTLGGLEKLQQINPLEPYIGGDDSKIAIGCLESVNMAITGLMRLYKEAVFDEEKWTYVVPPNLRKFSVTVYVTEIRDLRMQGAIKEEGADSSTAANSKPPKPGEIIKQGFKKTFGKNSTPKSNSPNINTGGELNPTDKATEATYNPDEDLVGENRKPFFAYRGQVAADAKRLRALGIPLTPEQLAALLGGSGRARIPWGMIRRGEDPLVPSALPEGARQAPHAITRPQIKARELAAMAQ